MGEPDLDLDPGPDPDPGLDPEQLFLKRMWRTIGAMCCPLMVTGVVYRTWLSGTGGLNSKSQTICVHHAGIMRVSCRKFWKKMGSLNRGFGIPTCPSALLHP